MNNYFSEIKPHYDKSEKPITKVNNLNREVITEMVGIIKKNKKILDELKEKNENLHK